MNRFCIRFFFLAFLLATNNAVAKPPKKAQACKATSECTETNFACHKGKCVYVTPAGGEDGEQCQAGADCNAKCESKAYTFQFCCADLPGRPGFWGADKKGKHQTCRYWRKQWSQRRETPAPQPVRDGVSPTVTPEPPGENCPTGGTRLSDGNGNVSFACNGPQGVQGQPGLDASYEVNSWFNFRLASGQEFVGSNMISTTELTFGWHDNGKIAELGAAVTADNESGEQAIGWRANVLLGAWLGAFDLGVEVQIGGGTHALVDHLDVFTWGVGGELKFRFLWWASTLDWVQELLVLDVSLLASQEYHDGDAFRDAEWYFHPSWTLGVQATW